MKKIVTLFFLVFSLSLQSQEIIPDVIEVMPEYPGGEEAMLKFIYDNIKYPAVDRENGIQGMVVVRYIIDETGLITDVEIEKSVSPRIDKEAMRVIKMMPKWTPGSQDGEPVKVYFNLPIKFYLEPSVFDELTEAEAEELNLPEQEYKLHMDIGTGYIHHQGDIETYFNPAYFVPQIGISLYKKKLIYSLRAILPVQTLKEDLTTNAFWAKDRYVGIIQYRLELAYLLNMKKVRLMPFLGFGNQNLTPWGTRDSDPKRLRANNWNLTAGTSVDIILKKKMYNDMQALAVYSSALRLRFEYTPYNLKQFVNLDQTGIKGSLISAHIGYAMLIE